MNRIIILAVINFRNSGYSLSKFNTKPTYVRDISQPKVIRRLTPIENGILRKTLIEMDKIQTPTYN